MRVYVISGTISGDSSDEHWDALRGVDRFHPDLKAAEKEAIKLIKEVFESLEECDQELFEADLTIEYQELIPTNSVINICKILNQARYVKKRKTLITFRAEADKSEVGYYIHEVIKA